MFPISEVVTHSALPCIGVLLMEIFTEETWWVSQSSTTKNSYHTQVTGINSNRDDGEIAYDDLRLADAAHRYTKLAFTGSYYLDVYLSYDILEK